MKMDENGGFHHEFHGILVGKQKQTRGFSQTWDLMGMFHKNAMGFIFPQQQYLAGGFKHEFYCP